MSGLIQKTFSTVAGKKDILIIGGTGTLGKALLSLLYNNHNITVLSREELKQKELMSKYPKVKFVLGDVRDRSSLDKHVFAKDVVFHLAAMKHVEMAEANPEESIKINLLGTINVAEACIASGVQYCAFSSTDKAVLPINVYGMCKGISERLLLNLNGSQSTTRFTVFRWGNVLGSRGSVIHVFLNSLKKDKSVTITDARMTRFWVGVDKVAKFMVENYADSERDRILIPQMKSAKLTKIASLCAQHLGIPTYKINLMEIRSGEKIHECLYSDHDVCIRSDNSPEYTDDELLEMISEAAG